MNSPGEDNWEKLKRLLKYLNGTKYLNLTISVKDLGVLQWYVDAAHNVHWDCKGHAGAMLTFGEGAALSYSRKVKLNTQSSTKTELVGGDMYTMEMLWSLYFIQSQGYNANHIELHQNDTSTQLVMKNGKFSSGKKTKHIKSKFFCQGHDWRQRDKGDELSNQKDVGRFVDKGTSWIGSSKDERNTDEL